MNKSAWKHLPTIKDPEIASFDQSNWDDNHIIVTRFRSDGSKEVIGNVYRKVEAGKTKYISTNRKGKEIFTPTTHLSEAQTKFDRYAHLIALQERARETYKEPLITNNHSRMQNSNLMHPQTLPEQNQLKVKQLVFVEYEKTAGDGHFMTIADSNRTVIGRIHKSYNDELKKYEYAAFDHDGKLMSQNEKLWELKKEFIKNRTPLLEQAQQRRNENIEKTNKLSKEAEKPRQFQRTTKTEERKKETEKVREGKGRKNSKAPDKTAAKNNEKDKTQHDREQELAGLRSEEQDEKGDMDVGR